MSACPTARKAGAHNPGMERGAMAGEASDPRWGVPVRPAERPEIEALTDALDGALRRVRQPLPVSVSPAITLAPPCVRTADSRA